MLVVLLCLAIAGTLIAVIVTSAPFSHTEALCAANIGIAAWNCALLSVGRIAYIFQCALRENFVALSLLADALNTAVGLVAFILYDGSPTTVLAVTNLVCFGVCACVIVVFQLWYCLSEIGDYECTGQNIPLVLWRNIKSYWQCCLYRNRVETEQVVINCCC